MEKMEGKRRKTKDRNMKKDGRGTHFPSMMNRKG